jgi:hypothetical protein
MLFQGEPAFVVVKLFSQPWGYSVIIRTILYPSPDFLDLGGV